MWFFKWFKPKPTVRRFAYVEANEFLSFNPVKPVEPERLAVTTELHSEIIYPEQVLEELKALVPGVDYSKCFFADELYVAYQLGDYDVYLYRAGIWKRQWQELKFDCDDRGCALER